MSWAEAVTEKHENWEDEIPPEPERDPQPGWGLGTLPALRGLHPGQVHQVRLDWRWGNFTVDCIIDWPWKLFLSYFRSLPLPKLGLNNSCWNAGKKILSYYPLRSSQFLLSFTLKKLSKNPYHVCLFNFCPGVNHFTSTVRTVLADLSPFSFSKSLFLCLRTKLEVIMRNLLIGTRQR